MTEPTFTSPTLARLAAQVLCRIVDCNKRWIGGGFLALSFLSFPELLDRRATFQILADRRSGTSDLLIGQARALA